MSRDLMRTIRDHAKSRGVTQGALAKTLGVSVPTLKRWLAGDGVSLEQALTLMDVLGLSLPDVAEILRADAAGFFHYTLEQEEFFAEHPTYLAYFDHLLAGKAPRDVARETGLSERSTRRYLKALDDLGLIERLSEDHIKLKVKGEPRWRKNGQLAKRLKADALTEYFDKIGLASAEVALYLFSCASADLGELRQAMSELKELATRLERKADLTSARKKDYGLVLSLAPFKWRLLDTIDEL